MLGRTMTTWYIEFSAPLPPSVSRERAVEHVEDVLLELETLDSISDADVMIDHGTGRVMFSMYVAGEDQAEALTRVATGTRTAIHAAGGGTPGWETLISRMLDSSRYEIRREDAAV